MQHSREPFEVIELDQPMNDWTGAQFIVRSESAPGGIAVFIGGLGRDEEKSKRSPLQSGPVTHGRIA